MDDPFYNRKPVPNEFIEHVGFTGMAKQEEYLSRERKLSSTLGDLRRFSNPKSKDGKLDPHYARKPVPDSMIHGVGETGLSREEEYLSREKKMFDQSGVDLRRFSTSASGGMAPQNDPYYGRKPVAKPEIDGVGDSGMSKAEEFETRENKASLFDLTHDPFQLLTGSGHRASISAVASAGAADARRRSSAAAPDAARAATNVHGHGAHSGYTGEKSLPPIHSGQDNFVESSINPSAADNTYNYGSGTGTGTTMGTNTTTTTTTTTSTMPGHTTHGTHGTDASHGQNQHGLYHDITTHDPDSVAPDERR